MYYQISLEGYQTICVRSFSFAKGQQAFESIYKPVSIQSGRITQKKEHLLMWNSETTQNLNIYFYNYQTETAIFLATNHEKNNMTCIVIRNREIVQKHRSYLLIFAIEPEISGVAEYLKYLGWVHLLFFLQSLVFLQSL